LKVRISKIDFQNSPALLEELTNLKDLRGNSPLLLALMLRTLTKDSIYLDIIKLLLKNKAYTVEKNHLGWSPAEESILNVLTS
jgi:ankyrin repeat protein